MLVKCSYCSKFSLCKSSTTSYAQELVERRLIEVLQVSVLTRDRRPREIHILLTGEWY